MFILVFQYKTSAIVFWREQNQGLFDRNKPKYMTHCCNRSMIRFVRFPPKPSLLWESAKAEELIAPLSCYGLQSFEDSWSRRFNATQPTMLNKDLKTNHENPPKEIQIAVKSLQAFNETWRNPPSESRCKPISTARCLHQQGTKRSPLE